MEASALHLPQGLSRISAAGPLLRLRSDDQLVALFRMGYDDAFRVIHDRYRQRLFAYTRQMLAGSRSDAEDALQDVFLRAYGALRQDDRPVTLRAWLYRVAHNRCVDQLRRPLPAPVDLFDVSRLPLHDPLAEAERREDLRRLVEDVRRLPEQQRSALLMRELEGLSYAELADALDITIPAVKSVLVRARLGLVEASDARDTACTEIRSELALAFDRGVRASGRSRRHMRDCAGCRDYRQALRGAHAGLGALSPGAGPLSTIAKLLGLGGAGSGAAAGGTVAASGGAGAGAGAAAAGGGGLAAGAGTGAAVAAGGAATATATKVAAIVGAAAVVGGGAAEVKTKLLPPEHHPPPPARVVHAAPPATASAPTAHAAALDLRRRVEEAADRRARRAAKARADAKADPTDAGAAPALGATDDSSQSGALSAPREDELLTGGVAGPEEPADTAADPAMGAPAPTDSAAQPGAPPATGPADQSAGAATGSPSPGTATSSSTPAGAHPATDAHAASMPPAGTPAAGQAPAAAPAP
ncbi:MAG TPA: sigma-70 family RNA polymerase sigma factor [Solirubrobacteraceae bacterium]|nr:sigma-70 family RNA polymerase sigma factor [Solirubrobacteraceae bacterium]